MAIRATSVPMLISASKSIVCLDGHAVECLFLLVLLSALPLSALGCTYGLVPWAEKGGNLMKEPPLPPFFSLSQVFTDFYSRLLHQDWKALGLWQQHDKIGKDSCS